MIVAFAISIIMGLLFWVIRVEKVIDIGELQWVLGGMKSNGMETSKITFKGKNLVKSSKRIRVLPDMPYLYVSWFPEGDDIASYVRIDVRNGAMIGISGESMSDVCHGRRFLRFGELKDSCYVQTVKERGLKIFLYIIGISTSFLILLCMLVKNKWGFYGFRQR